MVAYFIDNGIGGIGGYRDISPLEMMSTTCPYVPEDRSVSCPLYFFSFQSIISVFVRCFCY